MVEEEEDIDQQPGPFSSPASPFFCDQIILFFVQGNRSENTTAAAATTAITTASTSTNSPYLPTCQQQPPPYLLAGHNTSESSSQGPLRCTIRVWIEDYGGNGGCELTSPDLQAIEPVVDSEEEDRDKTRGRGPSGSDLVTWTLYPQ
ncbi:hypothetical protein QOT17_010533 [Balamuthia mandrillaris]